MPDITMCGGGGCSRRLTCYRHVARPSRRQSWFVRPPVKTDGDCEHHWQALGDELRHACRCDEVDDEVDPPAAVVCPLHDVGTL